MIPGLWIAGRWLPDVEEWYRRIGAESLPSSRAVELIAWLVLGMLFTAPLLDLLNLLFWLTRLALGPAVDMGSLSTIWGTAPLPVYVGLTSLTTIAVYALVVSIGYRHWPEEEAPEADAAPSLALEEWFVLLAAAALVNHLVSAILNQVVWFPVPPSLQPGQLGSVGLVGAFLLGLAILAVILLVMLNALKREPEELA